MTRHGAGRTGIGMRGFVDGTLIATLVVAAGGLARADDWRSLRGVEIRAILERQYLRYEDGSEQFFNYGGLTEYRIGWPNEGRWRIDSDRYCALWPPATGWQCYDVSARTQGRQIRFSDQAGHSTVAEVLQE